MNRQILLAAASLLAFSVAQPAYAQRVNGAGLTVLGARPPAATVSPGKPYETRPPIGLGQQPAFDGQTRAPAVLTRSSIETRVMARGLNHPWGIAFLGDGTVLVTEKPGTMRVVEMKSGRIVGDVQEVPAVRYGGDAGLLDVVTDPDFEANRMIYFTYIEPRGTEDNGLVVTKAKLEAIAVPGPNPPQLKLTNVKSIFQVEPGVANDAHYGSRLLFDRNGYLMVSTGERFFSPTRDEAQSLYSDLGKVLRITTDGKPAPGNPFDRDQKAENHRRAEIWSYGHRNPQALAFQPGTGHLWEAEHGPQGGDEVNLIEPGMNYGWPKIAYGKNYDMTPVGSGQTHAPGMEQPRYYWDPTIAPGGMTFYDGALIPEWRGNLFVAALAGQHVARLVIDGDKIVGEERLLLDQHQRMRDVKQGPDGALWVVTDDADGRLLRLAPQAPNDKKRGNGDL